jgi:hypothetical protein
MAVAAAAMLPFHLALGSVRFELWPRVFRTGYEAVRMSRGPVQGEMGVIKEGGVRVTDFSCPGVESPAGMKQCLNEQGALEVFADVHPASHFWPIQLVEAGIVLALAALVLWSAFRLLRRNSGTHAGSATVTSGQEGTA